LKSLLLFGGKPLSARAFFSVAKSYGGTHPVPVASSTSGTQLKEIPSGYDVVDIGSIDNYRSAVRVDAPFPHLRDLGGQSHVRAPRWTRNIAASIRRYQCGYEGIDYDAHRLPVSKTAANGKSSDVLPTRQTNNSKVDNYYSPRRQSDCFYV